MKRKAEEEKKKEGEGEEKNEVKEEVNDGKLIKKEGQILTVFIPEPSNGSKVEEGIVPSVRDEPMET